MVVQEGGDGEIVALEASLQSLLVRAQTLVDEITALELLLQSAKNGIDIRVFKRGISGEKRSSERLIVSLRNQGGKLDEDARKTSSSTENACGREVTGPSCVANRINSSNLSWFETLWAVAKRQRGVTGILRGCASLRGDGLWPKIEKENGPVRRERRNRMFKENLVVDIVANNGLEWIKVSTITPKRLLFDMAKEGWNGYDGDSDSEPNASSEVESRENRNSGGLRLVRLAHEMKKAARAVRVRYQHPKIRFILANIAEGVIDEVDAVIADIRATGATVECSGSGYIGDEGSNIGNLSLRDDDLRSMLPSNLFSAPRLKPTVNIDCTILLSLVSDISHVLKEDLLLATAGRYCKDVLTQIEADARSPLLPNELYPVLIDTDLVCTTEAVRRMREIVQTMGTHTEKMRADVLFGEGTMAYRSSDQELLSALKQCSVHAVPSSLRLPIEVIDFHVDAVLTRSSPAKYLPVPIANNVINTKLRLSTVNKSIFLYGWDAGIYTITGNRTVTSQIQRAINEALDEADDEADDETDRDWHGSGPDTGAIPLLTEEPAVYAEQSERGRPDDCYGPGFWYSMPRSLIGKDKGKEGGIDHLNASCRALGKRLSRQPARAKQTRPGGRKARDGEWIPSADVAYIPFGPTT